MADSQHPDARGGYLGLSRGFEAALAATPGSLTESWLHIAGRPARIRIVGRALARSMARPFRHLAGPPPADGRAALRIDLWDEAETGIACEGGDPAGDPTGPGLVLASEDGRFVVHARARTRTGLDRRDAHLVGWTASAEQQSLYELGRPLHAPLLLWLSDRRVQAVHAGLVARPSGGILFGGPGGAGKTTVALTCLQAGFAYLADDYVGLEESQPGEFEGHSLYVSTHLTPDHLRRFPALLPHAIPAQLAGEEKSLVLLPQVYPDRYAVRATIRAVALPIVTGRPTTSWRRASRVEALLRLAPSSLFMLPHVGAGRGFKVLAGLVEAVPTVWLELGTDLSEIPVRVAEILEVRGAR